MNHKSLTILKMVGALVGLALIAYGVIYLVLRSNSGSRTLTSATGSIYECLVVAPSTPLTQDQLNTIASYNLNNRGSAYEDPVTNIPTLISAVMGEPMPCMPQAEPYFKITNVTPATFDDFLKPTRNILIADINRERYTTLKAYYLTDQFSHPQAVVRIQAPSAEDFITWWLDNGITVRNWFVSQEIDRAVSFLRGGSNNEARRILQERCGIDMLIPSDYQFVKDSTDFVWCCNNKGPMRKDLVIWRYDYTDVNQLTLGCLTDKRDEVLGAKVSASVPGSHMGTEYKYFPPQMSAIPYGVEVRGLWKMLDGEAMGGPYVSHSIVDSTRTHIVTAETFIFAPGQKKRSALRQAEAILWTMK